MQKVTLQEIVIQQIISYYPDDILLKFRTLINEMLRCSEKEIVIAIDPYIGGFISPLEYGLRRTIAIKLFLNFLLKFIELPIKVKKDSKNIFDLTKKAVMHEISSNVFEFSCEECDEISYEINNLKSDSDLKSYSNLIKWYIQKLKEDNWRYTSIYPILYEHIYDCFRFGFDMNESREIFKLHKQFVDGLNKSEIPYELNLSHLVKTVKCQTNNYVMVVKTRGLGYHYLVHKFENINDFDVYKESWGDEFKIYKIE